MAKARKLPETPQMPPFDPDALDALLGDRTTAEELDELFRQMKKSLMERVLRGELTHHLGYKPGEPKPEGQRNQRNGHSAKTVLTDDGAVPVAIPRDRDGTFEPLLIPKHERRLPRFDQSSIRT
jgi:putative transposase